jgi:hypothetical protein
MVEIFSFIPNSQYNLNTKTYKGKGPTTPRGSTNDISCFRLLKKSSI